MPAPRKDIVADARQWLADIGGGQRLQTHSDYCHQWHLTCLVGKLIREIERLRTPTTHATQAEGSVQGEGTVGERLVTRVSLSQSLLNDNEKLRAEIGRTNRFSRLIESEREAIQQAIDAANGMAQTESWAVDTLRNLLERLT